MVWIKTVAADEATGQLADLYHRAFQRSGRVPQLHLAHSLKPELLKAWQEFSRVVTFGGSSLGREREELLAVAIGGMLHCEYCTVSHAGFLRTVNPEAGSKEQLLALATNYHEADLVPADEAMLEYAEKITFAPSDITEVDILKLREHGFTDQEILEIATIASYRNYISRVADALGVRSEESKFDEDREIRKSLLEALRRKPTDHLND